MKKILIANRGEIAIRVMRAATELGLRTVAVFSEVDKLSLHRFKADEAYVLSKSKGPIDAYLDVEEIIAIAKEKNVDAIHPGYGFLSEEPRFSRRCAESGITFVGPSSELLEKLGNKVVARHIAKGLGISVIPGADQVVKDLDQASIVVKELGFPLIIKATYGGGGRGMRIIRSSDQLENQLEEARREAEVTFGDGSLFMERFIERAKHVEVQILADSYGQVMHLYERDCSIQRRYQKVVEVAPAAAISLKLRKELYEASMHLAQKIGYVNAGTVEFLVDLDRESWYFMEFNPRIQVEHTVTEMVTGIDLVRSQILIAQGCRLQEPPLSLPLQKELPLYGTAVQCRITTEDPQNGFAPDFGKITTYRSPSGFGLRLDGGNTAAGAVLVPFYDSLLVKATAWGRTFKEACQRMDRSLREFRIRGVKTNIPFLENVINHPNFQDGNSTITFLDDTPELFRFARKKDRASRLLRFLAEVIVNGNPQINDRHQPEKLIYEDNGHNKNDLISLHRISSSEVHTSSEGTRQILLQLGPKKFSEWINQQKRLLITDTTFRDAHQSLLATRVRTIDLLKISELVANRLPQLFSLEMWGGATFDTSFRFLNEDPWQRLDVLRERIPNICFQMLLRASNAVGYTSYPQNVVSEFVKESKKRGIDIFRVFDSLNSVENMKGAMAAIIETNAVCEAAICYTGDILDNSKPKYSLSYYVEMARKLEKFGAHILAIKDMAGLCKPYAAHQLIKVLRQEISIPIHFHTHDTSGINSASILKACEAEVDIVDAATSSMSGNTSQPNLNSVVEALRFQPRDTQLDPLILNYYSKYWEIVRSYYRSFDNGLRSSDSGVYHHEIPGGQYTNLKQQAAALGLIDRWSEVETTYAEVNQLFGDIVKVTPSSKVVGDLALFFIARGMVPNDLLKLDVQHDLGLPSSVIELFDGALGIPAGGWPKKVQKIVLRGKKPSRTAVENNLPPVDFAKTKQTLEHQFGRVVRHDEVLSYLLYPKVFQEYVRKRQRFGDVSVIPTPNFFYGMKSGEEITVDLEPGKTLVIKFWTISEPNPDGQRTVFFELNGQPREVVVFDESMKEPIPAHPKIDPTHSGHVGPPSAGLITHVFVQAGQKIKRAEKLFILEAMKMQSTIYAPISGRISAVFVAAGQQVEANELLSVIESQQ
ncbi:MAG: pyruvate carboxylase [Acidobacteriia bacterium]|nr:pyruvate carboxylase [Terriglobia bacterium]